MDTYCFLEHTREQARAAWFLFTTNKRASSCGLLWLLTAFCAFDSTAPFPELSRVPWYVVTCSKRLMKLQGLTTRSMAAVDQSHSEPGHKSLALPTYLSYRGNAWTRAYTSQWSSFPCYTRRTCSSSRSIAHRLLRHKAPASLIPSL